MKPLQLLLVGAVFTMSACALNSLNGAEKGMTPTEADRAWLLPAQPSFPPNNAPTEARIQLGKALFFDPRLSKDKSMSCATCHSPMMGWSDGLPTAKNVHGKFVARATPTMVNLGYNKILQWDGKKNTLEDQAVGPMTSPTVMSIDGPELIKFLNESKGYKELFAKAYPGEKIDNGTLAKAVAAYERTIISSNSPFDRWIKGDSKAMTAQQIKGFRLFSDPAKGNCTACHQAPNFTDNGFHNLGLASYGVDKPDMGRYVIKPLPSMKGAFKTPTLREIDQTAPYFHDGSAKTLMDVVDHYVKGGVTKKDVSPNIKPLTLNQEEKEAIVAFMHALTSDKEPFALPVIPLD